MRPHRRDTVLWFLVTTVLSAVFVVIAARNLENFRPVSGDDAWIMSGSYKLATQGVFGSDLYAGLFRSEEHYFFNLPVLHYLQAASFRVFGAGVAQARLPSLISATVVIWIVSWLAFRWYGLLAATLTITLLIAWRSNLLALYPGLPLLSVARSGRQDTVAIAWMWVCILLLDRLVRQPGRVAAVLTGASAAIATLTQFFGIFVMPVVAIACARFLKPATRSVPTLLWIGLGVAVVALPYAVDVARHPNEWIGQMFTIRSPSRVQLDSPSFYVANLIAEPSRYTHLTEWPALSMFGPQAFDRPLSTALLVVGIWPALACLAVRLVSRGGEGDWILGLTILVFALSLALVDSTKAPLYLIVLWPSLCLVMGSFLAAVARWATNRDLPLFRLTALALVVTFSGVVVLEGRRAYRVDSIESRDASRYLDVGAKIRAHLPERTVVLGPNRWWWALHDYEYLSLNNIFRQWQLAAESSSAAPHFADWIGATQARYILTSNDTRADLLRFPEPL
jgi:hypothetical protein